MNETVVITGANRGIGLETCISFLNKGYSVCALSRSIDNLESIDNPKLKIFQLDISKDISSLTKYLDSSNSKVKILINNAGKLINKSFMDCSNNDFKEVFEVNFFSVVNLIKALYPYFESSHIVNISSMGGVQGSSKFPGLSAYSASKAALINLTEVLAEEFKDKNISVNALALGAVQTEMLEEAFHGYKANTSANEMGDYISNFAIEGRKIFNGKVLSASNSTP